MSEIKVFIYRKNLKQEAQEYALNFINILSKPQLVILQLKEQKMCAHDTQLAVWTAEQVVHGGKWKPAAIKTDEPHIKRNQQIPTTEQIVLLQDTATGGGTYRRHL